MRRSSRLAKSRPRVVRFQDPAVVGGGGGSGGGNHRTAGVVVGECIPGQRSAGLTAASGPSVQAACPQEALLERIRLAAGGKGVGLLCSSEVEQGDVERFGRDFLSTIKLYVPMHFLSASMVLPLYADLVLLLFCSGRFHVHCFFTDHW